MKFLKNDKEEWSISQFGVTNDPMYHRLSNMDMFFSKAFECNYSQHSIEDQHWIAFVKFVEKNAFPCTLQYATGAHMNIQDTACMTAHPVFQINGNFTILVRMTFICTCSNCNSELAYLNYAAIHSLIHNSVLRQASLTLRVVMVTLCSHVISMTIEHIAI